MRSLAQTNHGSRWRSRQVRHVDSYMNTTKKPSEIFPERLQKARNTRELSQSALAAKAKLPASSISHFEAGSRKPSFDNLQRLAEALNVSLDYLLGRVDDVFADAAADPLYRDLEKLSARDRELARDFMEMLAERSKKGPPDGG